MDFCHLIVTCLFSMLRLPFDNQKVKGNYAIFCKNITIFLENIKVFFAAWECVKTKPRPYEPKDSIVHVLTHPPVCKVCTYASGYTYGGIRPHVYTYRTTRTHA